MGIYLPNMEMPTKGYRLILIHADGTAQSADGEMTVVPVPPHGRLVDADALMLRVDMHGTNKFGMLDDDIREFINASPTIIPAEEEV